MWRASALKIWREPQRVLDLGHPCPAYSPPIGSSRLAAAARRRRSVQRVRCVIRLRRALPRTLQPRFIHSSASRVPTAAWTPRRLPWQTGQVVPRSDDNHTRTPTADVQIFRRPRYGGDDDGRTASRPQPPSCLLRLNSLAHNLVPVRHSQANLSTSLPRRTAFAQSRSGGSSRTIYPMLTARSTSPNTLFTTGTR